MKKIISLSIEESIVARIEKASTAFGWSKSKLVETILMRYSPLMSSDFENILLEITKAQDAFKNPKEAKQK